MTLLGRSLDNADLNDPHNCQVKTFFSLSKTPARFLVVWHETALLPFHQDIDTWARRSSGHGTSRPQTWLTSTQSIAGRHPSSPFHKLSTFDTTAFNPSQARLEGRPPNVLLPAPTICEDTADTESNLLIFPLQAASEDLKTTATFPCSKLKPSSFAFSSLVCVLGLGTHLGSPRTFS